MTEDATTGHTITNVAKRHAKLAGLEAPRSQRARAARRLGTSAAACGAYFNGIMAVSPPRRSAYRADLFRAGRSVQGPCGRASSRRRGCYDAPRRRCDMRKTVHVIDRVTAKVVASYPIELNGLNYEPAEHEYFALAFDAAVDDGIMAKKERDAYRFEFAHEGGSASPH
jgi:hypothetical protein